MFILKKTYQELVKSRDQWRASAEKAVRDNFEVLQISQQVHNTNVELLAELKDVHKQNLELLDELKKKTAVEEKEIANKILNEVLTIIDNTSAYWVVRSAVNDLVKKYEETTK